MNDSQVVAAATGYRSDADVESGSACQRIFVSVANKSKIFVSIQMKQRKVV